MTETNSYWEQYEKASQEESGGGGGLISFVEIETGYKVYASGVGQEESWFPAAAGDKASDKKARAVAKKAARNLADEQDCAMNWGIGLVTPKEKSYKQGAPVTWSVPVLVRFTANFWDSCNDIVIPSLKTNKIAPLPWQGWVRLGFQPDPYAVANDKKDEQGRYRQVAYVTEVFADETAAMKAVGEMPMGEIGEGLSTPPEYPEDVWEELKPEIVEMLKGYLSADESEVEAIALAEEEMGVTTGIKPLLDDLKEELIEALKAHLDAGKPEAMAATLVAKDAGMKVKYVKSLIDEIVPV